VLLQHGMMRPSGSFGKGQMVCCFLPTCCTSLRPVRTLRLAKNTGLRAPQTNYRLITFKGNQHAAAAAATAAAAGVGALRRDIACASRPCCRHLVARRRGVEGSPAAVPPPAAATRRSPGRTQVHSRTLLRCALRAGCCAGVPAAACAVWGWGCHHGLPEHGICWVPKH
jgi:hypothetical protein